MTSAAALGKDSEQDYWMSPVVTQLWSHLILCKAEQILRAPTHPLYSSTHGKTRLLQRSIKSKRFSFCLLGY